MELQDVEASARQKATPLSGINLDYARFHSENKNVDPKCTIIIFVKVINTSL